MLYRLDQIDMQVIENEHICDYTSLQVGKNMSRCYSGDDLKEFPPVFRNQNHMMLAFRIGVAYACVAVHEAFFMWPCPVDRGESTILGQDLSNYCVVPAKPDNFPNKYNLLAQHYAISISN